MRSKGNKKWRIIIIGFYLYRDDILYENFFFRCIIFNYLVFFLYLEGEGRDLRE